LAMSHSRKEKRKNCAAKQDTSAVSRGEKKKRWRGLRRCSAPSSSKSFAKGKEAEGAKASVLIPPKEGENTIFRFSIRRRKGGKRKEILGVHFPSRVKEARGNVFVSRLCDCRGKEGKGETKTSSLASLL